MTTHDLSPVWKALRNALLADAGLVGRLGQADGIVREFPGTRLAFPVIVFDVRSLNPEADGTMTRLWRPDLQLDIFSVSTYQAAQIDGYLRQHWQIPLTRAAAVTASNLRMTSLRHVNSVTAGRLRVVDTGQDVHQLATEWRARVLPAPQAESSDSESD